MIPRLLVDRLLTALRRRRRYSPLFEVIATNDGHFAARIEDRRLYVVHHERRAPTWTELADAPEVPLSSLPLPWAVDLAAAMHDYEDRRRPALVMGVGGEA